MQSRRNGLLPRTAAIVLAVMVALTAVGFASGAFRSIFRDMIDVYQNGPATDYVHMEQAANADVFEQKVTFESGVTAQVRLEQSYYNGRQLATGWSIAFDAAAELLDKGDSRVADAEESTLPVDLEEKIGPEAAAEFYRRFESDGWAGAVWYECYLGDSSYLADAEKVMGDDGQEHAPSDALFYPETGFDWREEGAYLSYDEFETPLPQAAQDKASLKIARKAICQECWLVADGDEVYIGRAPAERVEMMFEIVRSEDYEEITHETEAQFPNHSAGIRLTRTPIRAEFSIENRISEEWKEIWSGYSGYLHAPLNLEADLVFDYEILVDSEAVHYQTDSNRGVEGMTGWFMLPADAKEVAFRPVYANSGAHAEEDIVMDLTGADAAE